MINYLRYTLLTDFYFFFFFKVISTPNMGLEFTIQRSRLGYSTNWASQAPNPLNRFLSIQYNILNCGGNVVWQISRTYSFRITETPYLWLANPTFLCMTYQSPTSQSFFFQDLFSILRLTEPKKFWCGASLGKYSNI